MHCDDDDDEATYSAMVLHFIAVLSKSLESREISRNTSLAPSRSRKLNFNSLSILNFQDLKEKSLSLPDL